MPSKSQPLREDLKQYKETLRSYAKELRILARRLGTSNMKLLLEVEHAAECCEEARDMIKLGRAPRKPKEAPYTGGGSWHPAGMKPGGRRW